MRQQDCETAPVEQRSKNRIPQKNRRGKAVGAYNSRMAQISMSTTPVPPLAGWGHCSRFHKISVSDSHDGADGDVDADAEGVGAADDFEQAAGGEFFD
jgi:hypothetical protein